MEADPLHRDCEPRWKESTDKDVDRYAAPLVHDLIMSEVTNHQSATRLPTPVGRPGMTETIYVLGGVFSRRCARYQSLATTGERPAVAATGMT